MARSRSWVAGLAGALALCAAAPDRFTAWLNEEVVYIVAPAERDAFLGLRTDEERDHFIEQFWQRRDTAFKTEHYRRIAYANQRFAAPKAEGWKTDRGRIYIVYGPPDEIDAHPAASPPTQLWRYRHIAGIGDNVLVGFTDAARTGDYRQDRDPSAR